MNRTESHMNIVTGALESLSTFEKFLWIFSLLSVTACYFFVPDKNPMTLLSSLFGVSLVLFVAKGTVLGQIFTVVFSVLYGIISFRTRYYSEMITYLGMNTPIAIATMIIWLKNPFKNTAEVTVAHMNAKKWTVLFVSGAAVTTAFFFILKALHTENLPACTVSIATSYVASCLEFMRSPYYAAGFMANDAVLIALWIGASLHDKSYISMSLCFAVFFINDLYGLINWQRMKKRQQ